MTTATELLHRLSEIGATVNTAGDRLVVRAGARRVPAELVNRLRASRVELIAALAPTAPPSEPADAEAGQTDDAAWWRREFQVRTIYRLVAGRSHREAEGLAWGDLQNRWHRLHRKQVPVQQCAGCDHPIGGLPSLDLGDGNRAHLDKIDCLIRYGARWRGDATRALGVLGLTPPEIEDA